MLIAKDIKASYRDTVVLDNVDLHIHRGEFAGVIGANGTGKTTLLKVLTGVKKPLSGTVLLDNLDMKSLSRHEIARIMAVVPQSSFVPPLFTVEDVVSIGRYAHSSKRFTTTASDKTAIDKALCITGTDRFRHRYISELSGGERQEVLIARALAQVPKILLLDEPTANLDIKHQLKILGLVRKLIDAHALTALMVIHDLNLAARFCNKLILLHNGKVHAVGSAEDVLTSKNIAEAYGVRAHIDHNSIAGGLQVTAVECLSESNVVAGEHADILSLRVKEFS
ncbi:MAG TPA: ABC transporter ATP-binding protein [Chitinispirillaceae bacterium]|nr:ABC transporter ATP-binding protein [Chitinispirillaceae bacterium]